VYHYSAASLLQRHQSTDQSGPDVLTRSQKLVLSSTSTERFPQVCYAFFVRLVAIFAGKQSVLADHADNSVKSSCSNRLTREIVVIKPDSLVLTRLSTAGHVSLQESQKAKNRNLLRLISNLIRLFWALTACSVGQW